MVRFYQPPAPLAICFGVRDPDSGFRGQDSGVRIPDLTGLTQRSQLFQWPKLSWRLSIIGNMLKNMINYEPYSVTGSYPKVTH